jgi:hypothetical protein
MGEPTGDGKFSWEGIQLMWVVLGFIGAALGISRMPPMTKRDLFFSLFSGVVCAAFAPQWTAHFYRQSFGADIPVFMNNTVAFVLGIGGMFIVPGLIVFWQGFSKDPWGAVMKIVDVVRGRRPSPPPADGQGEKP